MRFIEPCRICKTNEHLKPKQNSDTRERWVHCDKCGMTSQPSEHDPITNWNNEQQDSPS